MVRAHGCGCFRPSSNWGWGWGVVYFCVVGVMLGCTHADNNALWEFIKVMRWGCLFLVLFTLMPALMSLSYPSCK